MRDDSYWRRATFKELWAALKVLALWVWIAISGTGFASGLSIPLATVFAVSRQRGSENDDRLIVYSLGFFVELSAFFSFVSAVAVGYKLLKGCLPPPVFNHAQRSSRIFVTAGLSWMIGFFSGTAAAFL